LSRIRYFLPELIFATFVFLIYLYSLCPTVYTIDSGELATVSFCLGIAHPTGYPLYTLISYPFAHLFAEPITGLNLLSALFSIASVIVIYEIIKKLFKRDTGAIIITSIFAFAPIVWRIALTNEVYPLTLLFSVLIIYLLQNLRTDRQFYLLMYLIGLAFTNHIIIFALAIPVLFYILITHKHTPKKIFAGLIFGFIGLSPYLYLILRTNAGAEIAWGDTYNLQRLFWHITGKQYQVWMFSLSGKEILNNFINALRIISRSFLFVFIPIPILGFYILSKEKRKEFWLFLIIVLCNFLYAINYSIPDIESYYIPGFVALIAVSAYGLKLLTRYIKPYIAVIIAGVFPLINYTSCTLRNNYFGLDFGRGHIFQLPRSALLISTYWDIYSPIMYLRKVKGMREDLIVIDKELLRRTWYIKYLKNEYPQFYTQIKEEVEDYLVELRKFEYGLPYDPVLIQKKFINLLNAMTEAGLDNGVFFAVPFPDYDLAQVLKRYNAFPWGLVYEIKKDTVGYRPFDFKKLKLRKPSIINDPRVKFNLEVVTRMVQQNYRYLNSVK